ncbi:MAG: AMP-binding protein [Actinomycetota bacterium]|nr:AMP-binding protein [Actinomycetota bacterium]
MTTPFASQVKSAVAVARAGLLAERPDRLARAAVALLPWGATLAGGLAAATARYPMATAIRDDLGDLSYASLWVSSDNLARGLAERGIGRGTVVGILARNHRGFVRSMVGASKLGADLVFLNTGFAGPQLADVVIHEGIEAILYDDEFAPLVEESGVSLAVSESEMSELAASWSLRPSWPQRHQGAMVILTSGTTGRPKGARRSGLRGASTAGAIFDIIPARARDTVAITAPLFHAWGLSNLGIALALSATVLLRRAFDPEVVLEDISRHRADGLIVVPVLLQRVVNLSTEVFDDYDTSSLRYIASSGSALGGPLATAAMNRFGPIVHNIYGSTEVALAAAAGPDDLLAAPTTAGKPPLGTTLRVVTEDGRDARPGESGRVFVANAAGFDGYTGGGTKEALDGLMATGDVGHLDEDGRLFIDGRDDDMIVSGGENVYPAEIEELLAGHPGIEDAAVVGVEDAEYGTRLKALVVRAPQAKVNESDVRAYVRSHLARYKVPREVVFVDEVPRTTTGKLRRADLPR